jgi:hypothetical protein
LILLAGAVAPALRAHPPAAKARPVFQPADPPSAAPSSTSPSLASQAIDPPASAGALAPRWVADAKSPILTWLEPWSLKGKKGGAAKGHRLRLSRWSEGKWSPPVTIAQGTKFFANWADTPGAIEGADGTLYAHWLEKSGGATYDYGIRLARSRDGGATWTPLGPLNRDGAKGEHGFVSWLREGANVRAVWVDGREASMTAKGEHAGAMTLRSAVVSGAEGTVEADIRLDGRICDCCQTGAALGSEGPVVVYRDRSEKEIRDIALTRYAAPAWTEPTHLGADNWEIPGCPVNGPAIAAQGASGKLAAVAWFTGAAPAVRVQAAFSQDGGASFGKPLVLDDTSPLGRVDLVLDTDGSAIVSWYAFEGEGAALRLRRARPDGTLGPIMTLTTTTPARSSGFPRLFAQGEKLLITWVDDRSPQHLRAASLPLKSIP